MSPSKPPTRALLLAVTLWCPSVPTAKVAFLLPLNYHTRSWDTEMGKEASVPFFILWMFQGVWTEVHGLDISRPPPKLVLSVCPHCSNLETEAWEGGLDQEGSDLINDS